MNQVQPQALESGEPGLIEDGDESQEPGWQPGQDSNWRDVGVLVLGIAAVAVAIMFVQWIRERGVSPPATRAATGEYSSLNLGPAGDGAPKLGQPAPGFQLLGPEGEVVRLEQFRGRPVLINFWATWCVPCRKETPDLVGLQSEWGTTVQILGVNYYESSGAVQEFARNFSINYPLPLDSDGRVSGSYKLTGLPETFFLDAEGVIRDHRIGQVRPDVAKCVVAGIQAGNHDPRACR